MWQTARMLPFSEACERNKGPLLEILQTLFAPPVRTVLEIGSGTGQHAVYFARNLPHLIWQPTDMTGLADLNERIRLEGSPNVRPAIALDVRDEPWPVSRTDAIFSANTLHIMSWECVQHFFRGVGQVLAPGGLLCVYGPFCYEGRYTSDSNAEFDRYLKARDPLSGIRDAEAVDQLAAEHGLQLIADHPMPANNQTRVWRHVSCD